MQISKWGNSLAVRLPVAVVEAMQLREGDDVQVRIADERVFELKKKPCSADFLARLRKFRGRLPADFTFDRDAANERH